MTHLRIRNHCQGGMTLVDNAFIDQYMPEANGEYVKVYLFLLRCGAHGSDLTIAAIADRMECTERDVVRALKYWEKAGLLTLEYDDRKHISGILIARLSQSHVRYDDEGYDYESGVIPDQNPSVSDMRSYKSRKEFAELTYVAECYLGKPLSKTESDMLSYFLDDLAFPIDLIEYLIEYSVEGGHKSFRYMKAIAKSWAEKGITTVDEARADADQHTAFAGQCSRIMKAYGITGRLAGDAERKYMDEAMTRLRNTYNDGCDPGGGGTHARLDAQAGIRPHEQDPHRLARARH